MKARTLHRRLKALLCGVVVAAIVVVATALLLPAQSVCDEQKDYGYVYSGAKSSSVDFVRAAMDENSLLMLGSSEFSTPASTVPQVPANVFGTNNYGVRPMLVGEAFDQALWHSIALGALADGGLPRNKVAIVVSIGQYTDGGLDNSSFGERFSYSLYRGFCNNKNISEEARAYVRKRLLEQGVDETTVRAANGDDAIAMVDGGAFWLMNDLRLRGQLQEVRASGMDLAQGPVQSPDWDALHAQAYKDATERSTSNDWGLEDGFWTNELSPVLSKLEGARSEETYTNTPEYNDLNCFLDVCDACGIEPLVIIEPCCGPYYDYIGISERVRSNAYNRIRDVVASHPAARLADFSGREYEKYFVFDIVHFGWTGWTAANRAVYDFAQGVG